ncbi:MAG: helix-turn-helix domain-containing protein [Calditrichaeota bacterium]|nr:helix-turn-helix domain-containing protein [Calditrichota bacterium]
MQKLKKEFEQLRKENIHFIAVSNSEWYSLFKDEIRNSIAIEGIFANRNELLDVLERNKRTDTQKTAAILGYFESASSVYEYANNLFKENEFKLRLADIKQIHSLLMRYEKQIGTFQGTLGDFRKGDVEVIESHFTPVKAPFLNQTMKLFVKWVNEKLSDDDYDKLKLATISHVLFETIHPFRDGNGRVGRILLSFLFIGCGYVNIAIKGTNKENRNKYYEALEIADDQCELLLRAIESGKKVSTKDMDRYLEKSDISLLKKIIEDRLKDALERLKRRESLAFAKDALLPLRDAAKFFHYSQDYLRKLINNDKLPAQKKGKLWYVRVRDVEKYLESLSK